MTPTFFLSLNLIMPKVSPLKKLVLFTLYTIYCFDIAAIVIVIVLFTPLLLNTNSELIAKTATLSQRNLTLGLLIACYPLAQFFAAPMLGNLSDQFGRKLILLISSFGTAICFFLSAVAIREESLLLLFISRILGGLFAGNAALTQTTVSDMAQSASKATYMALFTVVGGFAWIVGPFIGAFLSNPKIISWFSYSTPLWLLGFIFLLTWGVLLIELEETHVVVEKQNPSLKNILKEASSIFQQKLLLIPLLTSGAYIFGWMIIQSFSAAFLIARYGYSDQRVGYYYAYNSLFWLLGGIWALFWFKSKGVATLNAVMLFLIPAFIFIYALIDNPTLPWWIMPTPNALMAISLAAFMALFSRLAPKNIQGKIFGAFTGLLALSSALASPFAGWFSRFGINYPFYAASVLCLITAAVYLGWLIRNRKEIVKKGG